MTLFRPVRIPASSIFTKRARSRMGTRNIGRCSRCGRTTYAGFATAFINAARDDRLDTPVADRVDESP